MILEETDEFKWAVRVAAYNVVIEDQKEAHARANARRSVRGSR